jgi:hypothetical protein
MLLYKIIVPIISLAFIVYSFNKYRLGKNTLIETILWSLIWVAIASIAIFPDFITDNLALIFGIKSNINAIIFLGLKVLFFIQYNLFVAIKRQNKTITELVKKIALQEQDKKQ